MRNRCKKNILLLLALIVSQSLYAYDVLLGGIFYNIGENKTLSVTSGYKKYSGSVTIPDQVLYNDISYTVKSIDERAFTDCSGLTSITIPNSVISIGDYAFFSCNHLTSITIPNSVRSIGDYAFEACSGLTSITIPQNVTYIGIGVFWECSGLSSIKVELGNRVYDSRNNCNAIIETKTNTLLTGCENTAIPNSVTSIGVHAFYYCRGLTSITIPNSVTSIGDYAFFSCNHLTSISIPNSVISIGDYAFFSCNYLTSITIPNSVRSIGDYAFEACSSLTSITIPQNVTYIGIGVFWKCSGLSSIKVELGNRVYDSRNNCNAIIETKTNTLLTGCKNTTIPNNVTSIGDYAFRDCSGLTFITIPNSVTSIGEHTLSGCKMAALIWDPDFALLNDALSDVEIGSNFLLYVKNASYAPSKVKNVIVNGTASMITLSDDGGTFYCPEAFKAQKILYTHQYSMETGGRGKGWETLALPFDVQKITHETKGEIVPFSAYSKNSGMKPFWLYRYGNSGFTKADGIQTNTPYIIAMPNQLDYNSNYILSGEVTFSAENVAIPATPTFSGAFVPSYTSVNKSESVSVLNVVNKYVNETGGYDAGSRFVSNLRDVRPFECYLKGSNSTRSVDEMIGEDNNEE